MQMTGDELQDVIRITQQIRCELKSKKVIETAEFINDVSYPPHEFWSIVAFGTKALTQFEEKELRL